MMLGPDVLFSPVVHPGDRTKTQYLPRGPAGWIDFHTGTSFAAGETVTVSAELGRPPIFVRIGAALVLASATPAIEPHTALARRLYLALAGDGGTGGGRHFEDDGVSWGVRDGKALDIDIAVAWRDGAARVEMRRRSGHWPVPTPAAWTIDAPDLARWRIAIETAIAEK